MLNKLQESTVFFIFKRQYIVFHLATFCKLTDLPNSSSICLRRAVTFSRIQPGSPSCQPNALSLTPSSARPPPCPPHSEASPCLPTYPSNPVLQFSVHILNVFFLKPISQFALSPLLFSLALFPCLLVFNFLSDYFGELTCTRPRISPLHPSPSSLP